MLSTFFFFKYHNFFLLSSQTKLSIYVNNKLNEVNIRSKFKISLVNVVFRIHLKYIILPPHSLIMYRNNCVYNKTFLLSQILNYILGLESLVYGIVNKNCSEHVIEYFFSRSI